MVGSWGTWFNRRRKKNTRPAARGPLFVEQLEKREVRSVVYWTGGAGTTNWDQAGNWSTVDPLKSNVPSQVLPGRTDTVIIDLPGVTVDHSDASQDVIGSLQVTAANVTLNLSTGNTAWPTPSTLDLSGAGGSGTFQVDQSGDVVHLGRGTLKDATVTSGTTIVSETPGGGTSPDGMPIKSGPGDGILDGVTLDGKLEEPDQALTTIRNGLILNGVIELDNGLPNPSGLTFDDSSGPQTLSGQGQIDFTTGSLQVSGATLTITAGITIHGGLTSVPYFPAQDLINGPIDNFGNIEDDSGGIIEINYDQSPGSLYVWQRSAGSLIPWTNNGTIEVSNGTLSLGGPWTNNGTITAASGTTLNLGDRWAFPTPVDPNPTGDAWVNHGSISTGGTDVSLGGNLTWSGTNLDLAALGLGKDTVSLDGTLDNSAHTLTLTPGVTSVTGSWTLGPGQIDGGTVDERAAPLVVNVGNPNLNGVTLIQPPGNSGGGNSGGGSSRGGNSGGGINPGGPIVVVNGPNISPTNFVTSLYQNLLNRAPDPAGLNFWVNQIVNQGMPNQQVATGFWDSPEHRGVEVDGYYKLFLNRAADPAGRASWINQLVSGAMSELKVESGFTTSAEFINDHANPGSLVTALYAELLDRAPSASEQSMWQGMLAINGAGTVVSDILSSPESYTRLTSAYYETYLNRAPDPPGLSMWLGRLQDRTGAVASLAEFILGSVEYADTH